MISVGAGLLAKAVGQSTSMQTDAPLSRASPLPQGLCLTLALGCAWPPAIPTCLCVSPFL
ncbi:hypothetical protein EPZ47_16545 [Pseudomonas viciae]|uniref:Uncharacterized protein n=1 Tax=Pseudomonas viciae TaxID=2505979 RepID=A0A4P7PIS5_9PSED|nr:hypothetical protein EPZ47_16545 [Pseudomonas viciae]